MDSKPGRLITAEPETVQVRSVKGTVEVISALNEKKRNLIRGFTSLQFLSVDVQQLLSFEQQQLFPARVTCLLCYLLEDLPSFN